MAPRAIEPEILPSGSQRAVLAKTHNRHLSGDTQGNMGFLAIFILFVIGIIIAIKFLPVLTGAVSEETNTGGNASVGFTGDQNLSASDAGLLELVPTIAVVILVVAAIAVLFFQLRKTGLSNNGSSKKK